MRQFDLSTQWQLESAIDRVWDAIVAVEKWPRWWRFVHAVEELEKGDAEGLGALRRYTWSSKLPYRLSFVKRVTALTPPTYLEGVAVGDLSGSGRWHLVADGSTTGALERSNRTRCILHRWYPLTRRARRCKVSTPARQVKEPT